ncbi:hypothetical protein NQ314_014547 [Rhamnusium bicolor]|uniref:Uncharacterized protein n=1 Tax=Rhamnusium bicolor TaxID=1586634 RepID=A0AAV8X233_9CUCU|nr:hypothetical protein NQ314_014547 [Rhamnusium bicolor]
MKLIICLLNCVQQSLTSPALILRNYMKTISILSQKRTLSDTDEEPPSKKSKNENEEVLGEIGKLKFKFLLADEQRKDHLYKIELPGKRRAICYGEETQGGSLQKRVGNKTFRVDVIEAEDVNVYD